MITRLTGTVMVGVAEFKRLIEILLLYVPTDKVFAATLAVMVPLAVPLKGVIWSQLPPVIGTTDAVNPLVHDGQQYVPNISHVFREGQHLYLFYEVYSPAKVKAAADAKVAKGSINLISSLELIQGSTKVFETPVVQATALNVAGRDAVAVQLDVPLDKLKPGPYIGQLNIIDDAGGSFAFPRFAVLVRDADVPAPAAPATAAQP